MVNFGADTPEILWFICMSGDCMEVNTIQCDTIRYDTIPYIYVRSKADGRASLV